MRPLVVLSLAALMAVPAISAAQRAGAGRGDVIGGQGARQDAPQDNRVAQRQLRQMLDRLVRNQVRPTEPQMQRLRSIDSRFEGQRVQLNQEERQVRMELRTLMLDTANVDQSAIADRLDRLLRFPARRLALVEAEQRELATFLTPLQRARYHAIQEQVRRRAEASRLAPGGLPPA